MKNKKRRNLSHFAAFLILCEASVLAFRISLRTVLSKFHLDSFQLGSWSRSFRSLLAPICPKQRPLHKFPRPLPSNTQGNRRSQTNFYPT
ncbi:MAG: hypothetical protein DYG96_14740 [Chlorobi bacterium CHB2]|nr:hypothetical protein [Chlorobi bacterium CHB2]